MIRTLGYILALIVLVGLGYGIYMFMPKGLELSTVPSATSTTGADTANSGTGVKEEIVYGNTATYRIEVRYPRFGIPTVDANIKAVVDNAVATFKEYPANPADSSVPQNELTGSFNSAYVGQDVVSVKLLLSEYTGGAHPNTAIIGVNVDPRSSKELTLDDALMMIGKSLPQVAEESKNELERILGDDIIAPEGADAKAENYGTFLVGKDRVTFIFNVYQVGPYSSGPQEVWFKRVK